MQKQSHFFLRHDDKWMPVYQNKKLKSIFFKKMLQSIESSKFNHQNKTTDIKHWLSVLIGAGEGGYWGGVVAVYG